MEWVEDVQLFVRKGAANPSAYRMAAPLLADILQSLKVGCSLMVQLMIWADLKSMNVILANQSCPVPCMPYVNTSNPLADPFSASPFFARQTMNET